MLGWGGGSAVKTLTAHAQDLGFIFQLPCDSSQSSITPVLGDLVSLLTSEGSCMYVVHIYTPRNICIKLQGSPGSVTKDILSLPSFLFALIFVY